MAIIRNYKIFISMDWLLAVFLSVCCQKLTGHSVMFQHNNKNYFLFSVINVREWIIAKQAWVLILFFGDYAIVAPEPAAISW
jgi:hypothetical protein